MLHWREVCRVSFGLYGLSSLTNSRFLFIFFLTSFLVRQATNSTKYLRLCSSNFMILTTSSILFRANIAFVRIVDRSVVATTLPNDDKYWILTKLLFRLISSPICAIKSRISSRIFPNRSQVWFPHMALWGLIAEIYTENYTGIYNALNKFVKNTPTVLIWVKKFFDRCLMEYSSFHLPTVDWKICNCTFPFF